MKQTAVESLIEALLPFIDRSKTSDIALHLMIEEHIAMEKEQSAKEYLKGYNDAKNFNTLITENFKSE